MQILVLIFIVQISLLFVLLRRGMLKIIGEGGESRESIYILCSVQSCNVLCSAIVQCSALVYCEVL